MSFFLHTQHDLILGQRDFGIGYEHWLSSVLAIVLNFSDVNVNLALLAMFFLRFYIFVYFHCDRLIRQVLRLSSL